MMTKHLPVLFVGLGLAAASLGGCSDARSVLGLERSAPDEFNVVSRAPLSLPPDFSLRPPKPGSLRAQDSTPIQQAKQTVFRAGEAAVPVTPAGRSDAEMALLKLAGAGASDPSIRQLVDQESAKIAAADRGFAEKLLFWKKPEPAGTVVDPQKEAQRLRENSSLGKGVTDGETPIIERKRRSLLEGIF